MLNRHNLNIAKLASNESQRFALANIRVTPKETIVTDGHLLMRVSCPNDIKADAFPNREDSGLTIMDDFKPFNLDREKALAAVKDLKRKTTLPVLALAAVAVNGNPDAPKVLTTDLENHHAYGASECASYPDVDRVMPKAENIKFQIALDPRKVAAIMDQFVSFLGDGERKESTLKAVFSFQDSSSPMTIEGVHEGQTTKAVLMPVNL